MFDDLILFESANRDTSEPENKAEKIKPITIVTINEALNHHSDEAVSCCDTIYNPFKGVGMGSGSKKQQIDL
jgi:hypothetical protein